jgi:dihydrofolate reductase
MNAANQALANTTIISGNLTASINQLKQMTNGGDEEILLFGSPSATHALIQQNLIDGYWLFVNPVILGKGIPLFTGIAEKIKLHLVSTHPFTCGVTELSYTVERQE